MESDGSIKDFTFDEKDIHVKEIIYSKKPIPFTEPVMDSYRFFVNEKMENHSKSEYDRIN